MASKYLIYMLLVAAACDYTTQNPIKTEYQLHKKYTADVKTIERGSILRLQRQVVQPKWLNEEAKAKPTESVDVRVTDESLAEAEKIRDAIQKTIDADTYAVNPNQPPPKSTEPASVSSTTLPATATATNSESNPTYFRPATISQLHGLQMDFQAFQQSFPTYNFYIIPSLPSTAAAQTSPKSMPPTSVPTHQSPPTIPPTKAPISAPILAESNPIDSDLSTTVQPPKLQMDLQVLPQRSTTLGPPTAAYDCITVGNSQMEFPVFQQSFPAFPALFPTSQEIVAEQNFMNEFNRLWLQFVAKSRKV